MIPTLVALLLASVICVPASRRLGFGSVLGYLVAGVVIGPQGLRLVSDVGQIATVSELGVVMLLFLIGLELRPQRLWIMRRAVFGLGAAQVVLSAAAHRRAGAGRSGWDGPAPAILGVGLALSSTAIVLPMLGERDLLGTRAGRDSLRRAAVPGPGVHPAGGAPCPCWRRVRAPSCSAAVTQHLRPWRCRRSLAVATVAAILVGGRFADPRGVPR